MNNIKFLITPLILLLFVVFTSCQKTDYSKTENVNRNTEITDLEPPVSDGSLDKDINSSPKNFAEKHSILTQQINYNQPDQTYNTQDKRMIIRSGTMSLEVDNFNETENKIKETVNKFSGYVTNSTSSLNANGKKQGTITIRVVSDKFDAVVAELSQIGKVMNQNISGKDVTEEYMDADARLKTQRELESRLLKLLAEKTARLTDVVEVEQKLSSVRENIERTEGRMRYLKDQASYSTLAVSVYEPSLLITSTGGGFFFEIEQSLKKGLEGFTKVLSGMITIAIALIPVLVILGAGYYIVRKFLRKRKLAKA
ncbi:MAG: DUF4349 domain-containing protein [Ignavibacteria bacterium]